MLFMVIEHFKFGDATRIRERFKQHGRMLPEGAAYRASWVDASGARCFQIMEAGGLETLQLWAKSWEDLIDFEFIQVKTSADFWSPVLVEDGEGRE